MNHEKKKRMHEQRNKDKKSSGSKEDSPRGSYGQESNGSGSAKLSKEEKYML